MPEVMILTARAATRIKAIQQESDNDKILLRIVVDGGGCSGFQYRFDFDDKINKDDIKIHHDKEALAIIDNISLNFVKDAEIDYVEELGGSCFKINNPNAKNSCGCGTSFSV